MLAKYYLMNLYNGGALNYVFSIKRLLVLFRTLFYVEQNTYESVNRNLLCDPQENGWARNTFNKIKYSYR